MAKTSMVEREKRRAGIVKKYAVRRAKLKELIRSPRTSPEARDAALAALQAVSLADLPREGLPGPGALCAEVLKKSARPDVVATPYVDAAALAAVLRDPDRFAGRRVNIVCSGGNISPTQLGELFGRG